MHTFSSYKFTYLESNFNLNQGNLYNSLSLFRNFNSSMLYLFSARNALVDRRRGDTDVAGVRGQYKHAAAGAARGRRCRLLHRVGHGHHHCPQGGPRPATLDVCVALQVR